MADGHACAYSNSENPAKKRYNYTHEAYQKNSRTKPEYRKETVAVGLAAAARAAQLEAGYRFGAANWLCADGASGLVGGMAFSAVCQVF